MASFKLKFLDEKNYSWLKKSFLYESHFLDQIKELENEYNEEEMSKKLYDLNNEALSDVYYCSKNNTDFKKYLNVINHWGVYFLPKEFFNLLEENKSFNILEEIQNLYDQTHDPLYKFLIEFCESTDENLHVLIIKNKRLDAFKWLINTDIDKPDNLCNYVAKIGDITMLKYACKYFPIPKNCINYAAMSKNTECFNFILENDEKIDSDSVNYIILSGNYEIFKHIKKYKFTIHNLEISFSCGNLNIIKDIVKPDFYTFLNKRSCLDKAVSNGDILTLKYFLNILFLEENIEKDKIVTSLIRTATEKGYINIIDFLTPQNYIKTHSVDIYNYVRNSNLEMLNYLYESGWPVTSVIYDLNSDNGKLCLFFALEHGLVYNFKKLYEILIYEGASQDFLDKFIEFDLKKQMQIQ